MNMVKIAVIDKHPVLRRGLDKFLISHFDKVTVLESDSLNHFHELFPKHDPDLIIIGMGKSREIKNLNVISMSRKWYPNGNVVVYDDELNLSMVSQYLSEGVSGYISKTAGLSELLDCVSQVMSGKRYLNEEVLLWLLRNYDLSKIESHAKKRVKTLSVREIEVAEYLADGKSTTWISHKLERKVSTISTIKRNIFKKLNVDNVVRLRDIIKGAELDS